MTDKKSNSNTSKASFVDKIRSVLDWLIRFQKLTHLVRFSFWISVLASIALVATSQSIEILRVIAEDSRHWLLLFSVAVLILSLISWYWARSLVYRFAPAELAKPKPDAEGIAARWLPRICGLIPFVGVEVALWRAKTGLDAGTPARHWLTVLLITNAMQGIAVAIFLYLRHEMAVKLRSVPRWPKERVKTHGAKRMADLPKLTRWVLRITLILSLGFFLIFTTSFGEMRVAGWIGPASLVLLSAASWIAITSYYVIYFGRMIKLPVLTPLLLLAFLFSSLDWNDNHRIRAYDPPVTTTPMKFEEAFQKWWESRHDKDAYKGKGKVHAYPVFIVTAEGGGITTAYLTATVLTAIQDRAPAFAQHVFAISSVSGGSIGTALYAGLAKRCTTNWTMDQMPPPPNRVAVPDMAKLQDSADTMLTDDYLSPLLAGLVYPEMAQKIVPFPIYSWDRARALEDRLETSWDGHANCGQTSAGVTTELSDPFYDFFRDFPTNSIPAIFFNTTNVETGERMFVTNLQVGAEDRFDTLPGLFDVNPGFNIRFSSAACLSGRFPVITPAGFLYDDEKKPRKLRYVDGGYYENSGTATGYSILMSLKWGGKSLYDQLNGGQPLQPADDPVPIPIVIRIGFPVPPSRNPKYQIYQKTPEEEAKYKGTGLSEISPIKAILNARGARGNDAVIQMETAIRILRGSKGENIDACPDESLGCMFRFLLEGDEAKLPLGWMLSDRSRCEIQNQVGSILKGCNSQSNSGNKNAQQLQEIVALLNTH